MQITSITFIAVWVAAVVGWVANIVQVVPMINDTITGMLILKIVGIFAGPLGSILGYIGMF